MQILTQRAAKKKNAYIGWLQNATIDRLVWINIRFLKVRMKICLIIR